MTPRHTYRKNYPMPQRQNTPPCLKKGGARADIRPYGVLLAGIVGQAGNTFFKEMND